MTVSWVSGLVSVAVPFGVGVAAGWVWARWDQCHDRWDEWLYGPLPPVTDRHEGDRWWLKDGNS